MAISPKCDKCSEELHEFGAILLSPPDIENKVAKFHICQACYSGFLKELNSTDLKTPSGQLED